ncbi:MULTISPECIES: hypothetical protein [unclassified Pseudomonas]|uniref:hypothetical protein n=1 Tax=unclassified Pseudomonas TaxID=196821 RepID=UPI00111BEF36|nr:MULTISPECIES: hypothetical protein [unclassified Pseudomonas]
MEGLDIALLSSLRKDKRMYRPSDAAHFALRIPPFRHDSRVLAFSSTEDSGTSCRIHVESGLTPRQRLDNLNHALTQQLLTEKELAP